VKDVQEGKSKHNKSDIHYSIDMEGEDNEMMGPGGDQGQEDSLAPIIKNGKGKKVRR